MMVIIIVIGVVGMVLTILMGSAKLICCVGWIGGRWGNGCGMKVIACWGKLSKAVVVVVVVWVQRNVIWGK